MRAAIYARFSTDLQNERSTEDQIDLCRAYAEREGLIVVGSYQDKARSGASLLGRDGVFNLLQDAQAGKFDVIIVEALDRLSRDMEDLAGIHKRLSFHGIQLRAVHEGTANTLMVGLRGLVGQLMREDNVHKIRRGMGGLVKQGLSAGGKAYGYKPDPLNKGKLIIVEEEAETVRRIFEEFAAGKSPRHIAHGLNRDRIAPPRGTKWNASTLNGNAERGYGILRNSIYVGKMVWNRVMMVKDPDTGKRVSRTNPKEDWQYRDVPELQIVPTDLWEKVQTQKSERSVDRPSLQQRPKRLLSGLLRCGCCGSGMSVCGTDRSGRTRIRCSAATESGTCDDPKTFYLDTVEQLVLDTLSAELKNPKRLTTFIAAYIEERQRLAREAVARRSSLERKIAQAQREMDRIVDAIAKGLISPEDVGTRVHDLRAERDALKQELAQEDEVPNVVALHPVALKKYEERLANLRDAVDRGVKEDEGKSAQALRDLVHRVTVSRDATTEKGVRVEIAGALNALISLQMTSDGKPNRMCVGLDGSGGGI